MSNALALAAVTECLKDLLVEAMDDVSPAIGDYKVSSLAPDLIPLATIEKNQINVFLYQVTPHSALRNADLPTRSSPGDMVHRPVLAVDLHFLITAYSKYESQSEILIGQAAQSLHSKAVLTRADIKKNEDKWLSGVAGPFLQKIADSGLSSQIEIIRFVPQSLNTEEVSKLWAAFQTHYRPTIAYQASVVLLEKAGPVKNALPVLTIGLDDKGIAAQADLTPPFPMLTEVVFPNQQIAAKLKDVLTLKGYHLEGSSIVVRFTHLQTNTKLEATVLQSQSSSEIGVKLTDAGNPAHPADPAEKIWAVGHYTVAVLVKKPGEIFQRTTNSLFLSVAPSMTNISLTHSGGTLKTQINCEPEVKPEQVVTLVIGDWEVNAQPHATQTDQLDFEEKLPAHIRTGDDHVFRLRIDGVESLFIDRTKKPLIFDLAAKKTIP